MRGVLLAGIVFGVLAGVSFGATGPSEVRRRPLPNVVWFISDDASPYLGAYGDPLARTPTIDRLAAEGIRFDVVHADAPVCAPSRFALITGMYSATAGPAHHMRAVARIPSFVRGWPELLRRAGYYTTNNSKTDYNADVDLAATWNDSSAQAHWRNRPAGRPRRAAVRLRRGRVAERRVPGLTSQLAAAATFGSGRKVRPSKAPDRRHASMYWKYATGPMGYPLTFSRSRRPIGPPSLL